MAVAFLFATFETVALGFWFLVTFVGVTAGAVADATLATFAGASMSAGVAANAAAEAVQTMRDAIRFFIWGTFQFLKTSSN